MPSRRILDFVMWTQRPNANLCWAAVALSVDRWRNQTPHWNRVCEVANDTPPRPRPPVTCCPHSSSRECDRTGNVKTALEVHNRSGGFLNPPTSTNLIAVSGSFAAIKQQIDGGMVVCASIRWTRGGGHEVVIWGYSENGSDRTVDVVDPLFDPSPGLPFMDFITAYRGIGRCSQLTMVV